ncbi:MAG: hypothetical protein C4289_12065, partial [Chloroflexota bacterium]
GAGWNEREHRAFGFPLPPVGERMDRLEEAGQVAQQYLAQAGGRMYTRWPSWETDPNQLLPFGVSDLRGYSTLTPKRTERFLGLVRGDEARLLDLASVTLIAVPPEASEASSPAAIYRGRGAVPALDEDGELVAA